jgi:hypothetical protein
MALDLYQLLHDAGLSASHRHFSTHWCDRAPNYLAISNGISETTALVVARKLWRRRGLDSKLLCLRIVYEIVWCGEGPL